MYNYIHVCVCVCIYIYIYIYIHNYVSGYYAYNLTYSQFHSNLQVIRATTSVLWLRILSQTNMLQLYWRYRPTGLALGLVNEMILSTKSLPPFLHKRAHTRTCTHTCYSLYTMYKQSYNRDGYYWRPPWSLSPGRRYLCPFLSFTLSSFYSSSCSYPSSTCLRWG